MSRRVTSISHPSLSLVTDLEDGKDLLRFVCGEEYSPTGLVFPGAETFLASANLRQPSAVLGGESVSLWIVGELV